MNDFLCPAFFAVSRPQIPGLPDARMSERAAHRPDRVGYKCALLFKKREKGYSKSQLLFDVFHCFRVYNCKVN